MQRMLVTGARGMVGSYVPGVFGDFDLTLTDISGDGVRLDVSSPEAVMKAIRAARPDVVLHLAAATDVDRCEQEPDEAYLANGIGTQNIALACQAADVVLVYISTAGVFWGDKPGPYVEFDAPNPINVYGRSKLAGEQAVQSMLHRYYIVRAGWMIGGGEKDKKFVGFMARKIAHGETRLRAVNDKFGNPTYAKDLLRGIRRLIETNQYGLYHTVNAGVASRFEVAVAMKEFMGRTDIQIEPVSSDVFPLPAPRARMEGMRNYKLDLLGRHWMRPWQEALREYIEEELLPILKAAAGKTG